MQQICHVKVRSPTAWQPFQVSTQCRMSWGRAIWTAAGPSCAECPSQVAKLDVNLEVQIWYSAWFSKIYLLVDICFCKCLTCVVLGLLRCRTCARPILCADDPEATLLKAHSCTNCITGFHVVSQWPAKTRAFELENATPGNPVAVRSSKKTLPTLALYSTLWTLRSFEHCRLWSEIGWPTPNAMRCQWPGSQGLKPVCCQTSARCERVHCQTYLIEHVGI